MPTLVLSGNVLELPAANVASVFEHRVALAAEPERRVFVLNDTSPVVVNLEDGGAGINFIQAEVTDGTNLVNLKITTADNVDQVIPCDPFVAIVSRSKRITALGLVRAAGQSATVAIIIGRK